jgi:hypothetical protein
MPRPNPDGLLGVNIQASNELIAIFVSSLNKAKSK